MEVFYKGVYMMSGKTRVLIFLLAVCVTASSFLVLAKGNWKPMQASYLSTKTVPKITIDTKGMSSAGSLPASVTPGLTALVVTSDMRPFALTQDGKILRLSNAGKWEDIGKDITSKSGSTAGAAGSSPSRITQIALGPNNSILAVDDGGQIYIWKE